MWSIDLFGPMARKILGQDGRLDNNTDTHSFSFPNQLHNTLMHVQCIINPDRFSDAVHLFYCLLVIQHIIVIHLLYWHSWAFLLCKFTTLHTFEVSFAGCTTSQKYQQSADSRIMHPSNAPATTHTVLPPWEQMWRYLNYSVDLMT